MAYTFDGPNKLILLNIGTLNINLSDLWSRYKDWAHTSDNAKYLPMADTVGGEDVDVTTGTRVPLYLFLLNGWRIRPQEANHALGVGGGILLVDGGGDPFVSTVGPYNVRITNSQPVQAIGYSTSGTSGPSAAETASAVWAHPFTSKLLTVAKFLGLK